MRSYGSRRDHAVPRSEPILTQDMGTRSTGSVRNYRKSGLPDLRSNTQPGQAQVAAGGIGEG
jgi:hypothetical protein